MKIEQAKNLRLEENINRDKEIARAGKKFPVLGLVAAVFVTGAFVAWQSTGRPTPTSPPSERTTTEPAAPVIANENAAPAGGTLTTAGYVEPAPPFPVKVTPLIPGRIDEFLPVEGQEVKAGEVIARMNTGQLKMRSAEIEAAAEVTSQKLGLAERELARARTLSTKGVATVREYDQAIADVRVLQAELAQLQAERDSVQWQIEQSEIRSPVDGVLFERMATVGHFINLEERHEIASIVDPAHMQVWADVNQRDAGRVKPGTRAWISLDAEPGREIPARVERILPRASLAKNTVRCVLRLEETSNLLRPDMSVKVRFSEP